MNNDGMQNFDVNKSVNTNGGNKMKYALDFMDEDDILDMNEEELMSEPLTLITRDVAMKVQSNLLRENKPAVHLQPYKYNNFSTNNNVVSIKWSGSHEPSCQPIWRIKTTIWMCMLAVDHYKMFEMLIQSSESCRFNSLISGLFD